MIRAIFRNGVIEPVESVPVDWHEGDRLIIEQEESNPTAEELDRWSAEVEEAAAKTPAEDHDRAMAAIAQHRAEAKRWMRREMGLPE
jgi:predicted DNA-binding antitoxin AbrB/MazE fold protein